MTHKKFKGHQKMSQHERALPKMSFIKCGSNNWKRNPCLS